MGSTTEIHKLSLPIESNFFVLNPFQKLDFVGLFSLREDFNGLLFSYQLLFKEELFLNYLPHLLLHLS